MAAKDKTWFANSCKNGCQICGIKFPKMKSNGLEVAHIVSKKVNGTNEQINCLVLCPNCAKVFDVVIKPAIYTALEKFTNKTVPENWKHGEGRRSPEV